MDPVGIQADPSIAWHDTIEARCRRNPDFTLGDRIVVTPFRRLIAWLASRYVFEMKRSPHLPHDPKLLLKGNFLEANGMLNHADTYAQSYIPRHIVDRGRLRFIRTEFFPDDFFAAFHDLIDTSVFRPEDLKSRSNESKRQLILETTEYLKANEALIYDSCPYWASVEKIAYDR